MDIGLEYQDVAAVTAFPSTYQRVTVVLGAMCPEGLPIPTNVIRWHVVEGQNGGGPSGESLVVVSGRYLDVERFIRDRWGDETFDGIRFGMVGVQ